MRGDNWDGTPIDLHDALKPVVNAMLEHQDALGMALRDVSRKAGQCHTWLAELIHRMVNPRLGRLCRWAELINAQELGLFLTIDGNYSMHPCYDIDQPVPWVINKNGRQIPDFRPVLEDLVRELRQAREKQINSAQKFINLRGLKITRNVIGALECGYATRSPAIGHLMTWAQAVGAEEFGVYVVTNGKLTEAYLLGGDGNA